MLDSADLRQVVEEHRAGALGATATVCGDGRWGWEELDHRVARTADWLAHMGVGPGDRVAWLAQGCHRYLELLLASARVGAIFAPLNWRLAEDEAAFVLEDLDPRVVVWQEQELGPLADALQRRGAAAGAMWVRHDDTGPDGLEAQVAAAPASARSAAVDPADPVLVLYTAAFAGHPNGALLSQRSLLVQGLYGILYGGTTSDDVYLNAGPLFHVGTLKATLATLLAGGTNVFVRRVDPVELCRVIDAERCTGAFLQPPTMEAMVEANRDGSFDLRCLRAKPGSDAWNAMVTIDGAASRHRSGYGQTELGGVVSFVDRERPCVGSAGRPAPLARVEVLDAAGDPVRPGEVGEIVVRGPMVANGYHRRAELTAHRQRGGWHHTQDLGRREPDGSLSFVGPLTRLIKSAAENIYPAEVEACLRTHPSVREVAVIGVPDATWGQQVMAVIVPEGEPPDPDVLIAHCRERIASYKKPRRVELVEALPRLVSGAVDYDELDRAHGGGRYPGDG